MPALPWTQRQPVDPGRTYLAMASRLPLRHRRTIPGFLRDAIAIRRQLALAGRMIGYALDAELARRTFWTFSVWDDQASLEAFAASDPHQAITRRLRPLMAQTRFEFFQVPGSDLPMTWEPDESTGTRPAQPRRRPVEDGRGPRNGRSWRRGERRQCR
jgi:hypothetical protein